MKLLYVALSVSCLCFNIVISIVDFYKVPQYPSPFSAASLALLQMHVDSDSHSEDNICVFIQISCSCWIVRKSSCELLLLCFVFVVVSITSKGSAVGWCQTKLSAFRSHHKCSFLKPTNRWQCSPSFWFPSSCTLQRFLRNRLTAIMKGPTLKGPVRKT